MRALLTIRLSISSLIGVSLAVGVPSPEGMRVPPDPVDAAPELDVGADLDEAPVTDDDGAPEPPEDVELPEPDETIVVDPDADAEVPADGEDADQPGTGDGPAGDDPAGDG